MQLKRGWGGGGETLASDARIYLQKGTLSLIAAYNRERGGRSWYSMRIASNDYISLNPVGSHTIACTKFKEKDFSTTIFSIY